MFDCLNEGLDFMRVYGIKGIPLPTKEKRNVIKDIKPKDGKLILEKCCNEVFLWNSFRCGIFMENIEPYCANADNEICEFLREKA